MRRTIFLFIIMPAIIALGCATTGSVFDTMQSPDSSSDPGSSAAVAAATPTPAAPAVPVVAATPEPTPKENPYLKSIDPRQYTSFTTAKLDPIPEHIRIMVVDWGELDGYEVIGYVEIAGETSQERILTAQKYARAYGGEIVMPKTLTARDKNKLAPVGIISEGFLIWRKRGERHYEYPMPTPKAPERTPVSRATPKPPMPTLIPEFTELSRDVEYPVYGKLPRLTYDMLLDNSDDIKGQNYRGTAQVNSGPYTIPEKIGVKVDPSSVMYELKTQSGRSTIFLIVQPDRSQWVKAFKDSKKIMEFVYKPLGLNNVKIPVLQLVDEMK